MTGVTTVLGVIAKPMLIQWAANMAVDYIKDNSASQQSIELTGVYMVPPQLLEDARKAHTRRRDGRAKEGTETHALVEEYVKRCITDNGGAAMPESSDNFQLNNFIVWSVANELVFLESEKVMYHPDWFVGGTVDLLLIKDGKKYICDIKTSKSVYYEAHVQMAAYRSMLEHMGEDDILGSMIIHLSPEKALETYYHYDYDTNLEVFKAALTIYRAKAMYDGMDSEERKERRTKRLAKDKV